MDSHVRISRFTYSDATVIAIDGQFDLASVSSVATPAEESILTRRRIGFEVSACTRIDASALRFLLQVARQPDVPMAIVVGASPIRSTFAVMSIDQGVPASPPSKTPLIGSMAAAAVSRLLSAGAPLTARRRGSPQGLRGCAVTPMSVAGPPVSDPQESLTPAHVERPYWRA